MKINLKVGLWVGILFFAFNWLLVGPFFLLLAYDNPFSFRLPSFWANFLGGYFIASFVLLWIWLIVMSFVIGRLIPRNKENRNSLFIKNYAVAVLIYLFLQAVCFVVSFPMVWGLAIYD